ncbi:MAG: hypothetical protein ACLPX5_09480 [Dissulfurispiraceae bacterium]
MIGRSLEFSRRIWAALRVRDNEHYVWLVREPNKGYTERKFMVIVGQIPIDIEKDTYEMQSKIQIYGTPRRK